MGEVIVATKSILVGEQAVDIIGHLFSWYTIYIDVDSTTHEVLAIDASAHRLIVSNAPARAVNPYWGIVMITDDLKDLESLSIYGIKTAPTSTGKLAPTKAR